MTPNEMYRIIVAVLLSALSLYMAFYNTPELDNVKNNTLYRFSYIIMLMYGWTFLLFDILNLFPLE